MDNNNSDDNSDNDFDNDSDDDFEVMDEDDVIPDDSNVLYMECDKKIGVIPQHIKRIYFNPEYKHPLNDIIFHNDCKIAVCTQKHLDEIPYDISEIYFFGDNCRDDDTLTSYIIPFHIQKIHHSKFIQNIKYPYNCSVHLIHKFT